jgi:hypothetical protein
MTKRVITEVGGRIVSSGREEMRWAINGNNKIKAENYIEEEESYIMLNFRCS